MYVWEEGESDLRERIDTFFMGPASYGIIVIEFPFMKKELREKKK